MTPQHELKVGSSAAIVAHLADMKYVTLDDDQVIVSSSVGARNFHYVLSTNDHGYTVGDSIKPNQAPQGCTLEDAILFGCQRAKKQHVKFSFYLRMLPKHVAQAVREVIENREKSSHPVKDGTNLSDDDDPTKVLKG